MESKNKKYAGITFLLQALSFFVMFLVSLKKKKSLANALLAAAAAGGLVGVVMLYLDSKDELKRRKIIAARDACCGDDMELMYGSNELDGLDDISLTLSELS